MASAINTSVPATNADLLSAPIRANWITTAAEITALQNQLGTNLTIGVPPPAPAPSNGSVTTNQLVLSTGTVAGNPGYQSRVGLNSYMDASGQWRYVDNGAAGAIVTATTDAAGNLNQESRVVILLADRNEAGANAPIADFRGVINMFYGPHGGGSGNDYVVIGAATNTDFPVYKPSGDTLFCSQLAVEPGAVVNVPQFTAYSRVMLNMYADTTSALRYIDNGPAGGMVVSNTHAGAPADISRLVFWVDTANSAGPGALANFHGAINIVSGPPGQPIAPFVVIGADSDNELPVNVFPRRGSLLANDIFIRSDPDVAAVDRVTRMGFNAMQDANAVWWTLSAGPSALVTLHELNVNPDGTPGVQGAANLIYMVNDAVAAETQPFTPGIFANVGLQIFGASGTPVNFASIALSANTSGTPTIRHVQVGPADSGGVGFRQLIIANN